MGVTLHVKGKHRPLLRMVQTRQEEWEATRIWLRVEPDEKEWKEVTPEESLQHRNHSPTGFMWGYGGSGPSQLALAILLAGADLSFALGNYMRFKNEVIAALPFDQHDVRFTVDIERWLLGTDPPFTLLSEVET